MYFRGILSLLLFFGIYSGLKAQDPNTILLRNYRPHSVYHIPVTVVNKAKFPVIDMHSHPYARSEAEIAAWVKSMDECGIRKTILLTYSVGPKFDSLCKTYGKYGDRFELWCGFDYSGYDKPGYGPAAVKELERCHAMGAKGVGELGDKGLGETYSQPVPGKGLHIDDPRLKLQCGLEIIIDHRHPVTKADRFMAPAFSVF